MSMASSPTLNQSNNPIPPQISPPFYHKSYRQIAANLTVNFCGNIWWSAVKCPKCARINDFLSRSTFDKYVAALEKLFVIQDIGAWNPSIRSKTAIRSGEKRSFCDPSVAVAPLGLGPGQLLTQLKTFGFIFECMCVRNLKVYSAALRYPCRTKSSRHRTGLV